jgi:nucleotide-binding universal stress UspA family protein
MIRSLFVPLDGSSFGEHALPLAASLARAANATLHLVHVHQVVPPATVAGVAVMDALDLHLRQDEQAYLTDVLRRVSEKGPLQVKSALIEGEVAAALEAYAARVEADLVVMSTHGRGALGRFWMGSVTDDLIRDLPRPVLLVHPGEGAADLKREPDLKHILLPLDGTSLAEQIIAPAVELGRLFGSTFHLLRVVQPAIRPSYLPDGGTVAGLSHTALEQVGLAQKGAEEEAKRYLGEMAARMQGQGCLVHARVVVDEQPAVAILLEARLRHAGLIAMETHGRRGLSRLLRGSSADKIVRGGDVPVLLHRPRG